jgi:hypothetical protein
MDLKQLTPTQLAVGAGLLVLLLILLLLLWLLGRSRGKARRRRERTAAALADSPTAALAAPLAAPPTEPTPTHPPTFPPPPGPVRPPPGSASESGSGRPAGPDQPADTGLTMFGSTPQSRGPYRVVQQPGGPNQPRTPEPLPNDRLAAEQQRQRHSTPPQPRASMEPTFDQPEQTRPPRDSAPGPDSAPGSPADPPAAPADTADHTDRAPDPESAPATTPVAPSAGHSERNGLAAVPGPPVDGDDPDSSAGDAKDRLLRVLLADPDRALHAVGDLEASRNQLHRLNDSMHYQRRQLADAARRLRGAGLTPAQVAQLAGFGEGELVSLLSEHTPSPTPRTPDTPPAHP